MSNLVVYRPNPMPTLGADRLYLQQELAKISNSTQVLAAAINDHEAAWTPYTPTVVIAGGGAGTASGRYKLMGKTLSVYTDASVTTGGTGMTVSLPPGMTAIGIPHIGGREVGVSGLGYMNLVNGTTITVVRYDNAFAVTAGWRFIINGTIEIA